MPARVVHVRNRFGARERVFKDDGRENVAVCVCGGGVGGGGGRKKGKRGGRRGRGGSKGSMGRGACWGGGSGHLSVRPSRRGGLDEETIKGRGGLLGRGLLGRGWVGKAGG